MVRDSQFAIVLKLGVDVGGSLDQPPWVPYCPFLIHTYAFTAGQGVLVVLVLKGDRVS